MAGTYTESVNTVFGDRRVIIYNVSNYTSSETLTVGALKNIDIAIPITSTADKTVGVSLSGNVITFATGADTYDGQMIVIGK